MGYTRRDLLALMGTAGALGRYGDAAAQDAAANAALPLAAIVERNDAAVRAALQSQIADPASPNRGSVLDQFGLHSAGSASGVVETLAASFVHPRSAFHRSAVLLERIRIAAGFLERAQSPQGNIDLLTTNFNSRPTPASWSTTSRQRRRLAGSTAPRTSSLSFARFWCAPAPGWQKAVFTPPTTAG